MGLDLGQFRWHVVEPALLAIGLHSPAAVDLVVGTALVESGGLTYLRQRGGGPALGIFQMEPATFKDHRQWLYRTPRRMEVAAKLRRLAGDDVMPREMVWNMGFAAAMCRIHYWRRPEPLPAAGDVGALAVYWKRFYNTLAGNGRVEDFVKRWDRAHR